MAATPFGRDSWPKALPLLPTVRRRWPLSPSYTTSRSLALALATTISLPSCNQLAGESMLSSGVDGVTNASATTTCGTS